MRTDIDLDTWNRKHLFEAYEGTDFPYINIGCDIDVTRLYRYTKEEGISFYFSMIYICTKLADDFENFRYRFEGKQPFIIDRNVAFATHLQPGSDIFVMVECDQYETMKEFAEMNRKKGEIPLENSGLSALSGRNDIINFSCIPWVSYTHFVRTISKAGVDCNPKMTFGKFKRENDKVLLPFSCQTHHGMMDGVHVGKYIQRLEEYIAKEMWCQ